MSFLRRLLGGPGPSEEDETFETDRPHDEGSERDRELEVLREEQARHDELTERQLRYAHYAWQPPAQGGERRADDEEPRADDKG